MKCPICQGHKKIIAQLNSEQRAYFTYGMIQEANKPKDCPLCAGLGELDYSKIEKGDWIKRLESLMKIHYPFHQIRDLDIEYTKEVSTK